MIDSSSNRLLMSDALKGMVPELEEDQIHTYSDGFVVTTLEVYDGENSTLIVGSLDGFSQDENTEIKLDVRVEVKEAFYVIKKYTSTRLSSRVLYLHLGDDEISFQGPYKISNPKMMSFDHQNRMCTLGVDLIPINADI